jgi:quercetin 2,3-dioxygenase
MKSRILYKASERGFTNLNWLKSWHTFNFANYYEEDKQGFGKLLVLNENIVKPGSGFGTHAHDNIEIITIPLEGRLSHTDNLGNETNLGPGDIQTVSSGAGIKQTENNPSDSEMLHFLEIWVLPVKKDQMPQYRVKNYDTDFGHWIPLIRPDHMDGCISIDQDFLLYSGKLRKDTSLSYTLYNKQNQIFVHVISGGIRILDEKMNQSDAIGIKNMEAVDISCIADAHFLLMEIPFG